MEQTLTTDQYYSLKGLSSYSAMGVPTLRDYMKSEGLPYFKLKGKVLIKRSEFDKWLERYRVNQAQDLSNLVDSVMASIK